ncbi:CBS domain-containing protein [Thiothrix fructosivorans]|uniref:CBS domain-containing protein n=1 Tax=Thiothrix fructosivorans TaxID=111770 RepID=A0A8B0SKX5_9GAMM|nr:CBS domain-containing protein [Thiothrix fructosivorans]MBO0613023.1 CBS domain-containing protein [Thiothrix fructosivorans]QTX11529.1 CBS domain-containing protein [Thiothrix fructosivorans]
MAEVSLSVRHYMSSRLATLYENQDIREAVKIFTERNLFGGAVMDNRGSLVGILSVTDCIDAALRSGYHSGWRGTVGEKMSRDIRTVDAEDSILDVAKMFMDDHYRRYPVVDDNRVVGVITRLDVLKALRTVSASGFAV